MKKITQQPFFSKIEYFILAIILFFGFLVRLYKINIPLTDHHSWRQADTAAVARNYARYGINLLYPQLDNMAPTHSPEAENPNRLYLVEFPIYNALIALVYKIWGIKEAYGRLVTIFFSLWSTVILYFLTKRYFGRLTAILASSFFAFLPFNVYFSRVILPEPMMIACILSGIYFFDLWLEKKKNLFYFLSLFFTTLAFLVKPYSLFLLPVFFYFWVVREMREVRDIRERGKILVFFILSVLPFLLWRKYISNMPEGIPASGWLFNEEGIRFKGAFFRWLIFERMDKLILTTGGMFLFLLGLIFRPKGKEKWLFHVWLASIFLYFFVFAKGNVTHDYYQIIFVPIASIFMAKGATFLLRAPKELFSKITCYLLSIACYLLILAFGFYEVRNFYNLQMGVDLAGKAIQELTPKDALVITGDTADVTLLYNCDRFGWVIGYGAAYGKTQETIEKLRQKGADFYVTTKVTELLNDKDFSQYMIKNYQVLKKTNEYIIFDLRKKLL